MYNNNNNNKNNSCYYYYYYYYYVCVTGGEGNLGLVLSPSDQQASQSQHGCCHVAWSTGNTNVYKVGHEGKLDLLMIEGASGGFYYPQHLAALGHHHSLQPDGKQSPAHHIFILLFYWIR